MIEAGRRMITIHNSNQGIGEELGGMNYATKRQLELQIKTVQNVRDADKLERLLQVKKRQKEDAMYFGDTERLVTEIETLKVVLCLAVTWYNSRPLLIIKLKPELMSLYSVK